MICHVRWKPYLQWFNRNKNYKLSNGVWICRCYKKPCLYDYLLNDVIQIYSGITRGGVLNGPEDWREIFTKQPVDKNFTMRSDATQHPVHISFCHGWLNWNE